MISSVSGWRGRFFEDFVVGDVYRHALGRTVSQTDDSVPVTPGPVETDTATGPAIMKELEQRRIANSGDAFQRLYDLYEASPTGRER